MAGEPRPAALAGLVLCGGRSSRMGEEKALLDSGGEPLVIRVARRLASVSDPVMLAPGRIGRLGDLGFPEVSDEVPEAGPLAAIVAGISASPHPTVAVVAVDMPDASPEVFALLSRLRLDEDAVVPVTSTGPQPLHALYSRSALPHLRAALASGRLRVGDALSTLHVRMVTDAEWGVADPGGRFAVNLNTPHDLHCWGAR
jgi:molybdenum cofactor guanylyltransferase